MPAIWQNADLSPQEAIQRGANVYEVLLSNWGVQTAVDQWPLSGARGFPRNVAAIAIGPLSTVDRAYVTWNPVKPVQANPIGGAEQRVRRLTLASPLLFTQTAAQDAATSFAAAVQNGSLYVFSELNPPGGILYSGVAPIDSTAIPATYTKADGSAGSFANGAAPFNTIFQAPFLHLYLYLTSNFATPNPARRPLVVRNQLAPVPAAGGEHCVGLIPVYGRSCISVAMAISGGGTCRVGAIRGVNSVLVPMETTEGQKTAAANASQTFQFGGLNADYLALYVSPTIDSTVDLTVVASD